MGNMLELVSTRLHYCDDRLFLVQGFFSENKIGQNKIFITVDGKKVPVKMETREGVEVRQRYGSYSFPIDTEYFFWARFPEDIREKKKIEVWEDRAGKLKKYSVLQRKNFLRIGKHLFITLTVSTARERKIL